MSSGILAAQGLLSTLGTHIGLADLTFNEENVCRLVFDKAIVVDLEYLPDTHLLQVYSVVGNDPGESVATLRKLLSANLFGQGTGGAVLSLDEDRGEILLSRTFDVSAVDSRVFIEQLDVFASHVEAWTAELVTDSGDDAGTALPDGPSLEASAAFIRI